MLDSEPARVARLAGGPTAKAGAGPGTTDAPRPSTREGTDGLALVLGFGLHGLALARALSRAGAEVHVLSQDMALPACATRCATVHHARGLETPDLVDILKAFRSTLPADRRVVLFPTNDHMVLTLGQRWSELAQLYCMSWAGCREQLLDLQRKSSLARRCAERGILHPRSFLLDGPESLEAIEAELVFPVMLKPEIALPSNPFKYKVIADGSALRGVLEGDGEQVPLICQQWIPGDIDQLFFCTMYVHEGEVMLCVPGRKLAAHPDPQGVGIAMQTEPNAELEALARRFVAGSGFSGPISVEFKRDPEGRFWLIEPNVGRVEHCLDLIVQHGINAPAVELYATLGIPRPDLLEGRTRPAIWFDTERAPTVFLRFALRSGSLRPNGRHPIFPYFGHGDPLPGILLARDRVVRKAASGLRRLRSLWASAGGRQPPDRGAGPQE